MSISGSGAGLATRTTALAETFAGRIPADDLTGLRSMAGGGEWEEFLDLLVAALRVTKAPVSSAEIDDLRQILTDWGLPTEPLAGLTVAE
jgi:hypothetical protein